MTLPKKRILDRLRKGQPLGAEMPPSQADRSSWVGVYPLDLGDPNSLEFLRAHGQPIPIPKVEVYSVRIFEVLRSLIEQDLWFGEDDILNGSYRFAYGNEHLFRLLEELQVPLESLRPHSETDYPI